MREVEITDVHDVGLYDSDTGESLKPERLIDISGDGAVRRTLLMFTRAKRGRIIKIVQPYEGEEWMGSSTHYFVDEPASEQMIREDARRWGCRPDDLVALIKQHAP